MYDILCVYIIIHLYTMYVYTYITWQVPELLRHPVASPQPQARPAAPLPETAKYDNEHNNTNNNNDNQTTTNNNKQKADDDTNSSSSNHNDYNHTHNNNNDTSGMYFAAACQHGSEVVPKPQAKECLVPLFSLGVLIPAT